MRRSGNGDCVEGQGERLRQRGEVCARHAHQTVQHGVRSRPVRPISAFYLLLFLQEQLKASSSSQAHDAEVCCHRVQWPTHADRVCPLQLQSWPAGVSGTVSISSHAEPERERTDSVTCSCALTEFTCACAHAERGALALSMETPRTSPRFDLL